MKMIIIIVYKLLMIDQNIPSTHQDWLDELQDSGYRLTAPLRAIVSIVANSSRALGAIEIFDLGRGEHPSLGLVTVYRTLDLLTELGLVRRVHRNNGCHGYLPATAGHYHALICRDCGRSVEFPGENDLQALIADVEAQTGYRVEEHLLQLSGLCSRCQDEGRDG